MSQSVVLSFINQFFHNIQSIIYAKTPNKMWLRFLLILGILLVVVIIYKNKYPKTEGFEQNTKYVLKRDEKVYDNFYAQHYDEIMESDDKANYEVEQVIEMTQPSKQSVFLDIGSGTGHFVDALKSNGYTAYGIDKSSEMVSKCEKNYPDNEITCGDAIDPMAFEHNTFTHILCTGFTIYQFQDKSIFFKNCYHWLVPNGYLIIHLVDRDNFNTSVPASKNTRQFPEKTETHRNTESEVDLGTISYKSNYDFSNSRVIFKETFTDKASGNVRQNEQTLYMDTIDSIIKTAKQYGFIVHSQVNMESMNDDKHQYLYVFERMM